MCVGTPMKITAIDGIAAWAEAGNMRQLVDVSLTPDARVGDWVLNFMGAAREILSEDEAGKITAALDGLRALMEGADLGDAFADLEQKCPQLPPHLQAAFDASQAK